MNHRAAQSTAPAWAAQVLTVLPEAFPGPLGLSLAGKALDAGLWALDVVDLRDFGVDKHRTVDDTPFGGGPGMVIRPDGGHYSEESAAWLIEQILPEIAALRWPDAALSRR